jgi:hypothetical protein
MNLSNLKQRIILATAAQAPRLEQAATFAKDNWRDIALGLAMIAIVDDIDDIETIAAAASQGAI